MKPQFLEELQTAWTEQISEFNRRYHQLWSQHASYAFLANAAVAGSVCADLVSRACLDMFDLAHQNCLYGSDVFRMTGAFPVTEHDVRADIEARMSHFNRTLRHIHADLIGVHEDLHELSAEASCAELLPDPVDISRPPQVISTYQVIRPQSPSSLISKPLSTEELDSGYIYAFTKIAAPGYVKIGYTIKVDTRLTQWSEKCKSTAVLHYERRVLNPKRVEGLILHDLQLQGHRYREQNCPGCGKDHIELSDVSVNEAERVIDYWGAWMSEFTPYDGFGRPTRAVIEMLMLGVSEDISDDARRFLSDSAGKPWCHLERKTPKRPPPPQETVSAPARISSALIGDERDNEPSPSTKRAARRHCRSLQATPTKPKARKRRSSQSTSLASCVERTGRVPET